MAEKSLLTSFGFLLFIFFLVAWQVLAQLSVRDIISYPVYIVSVVLLVVVCLGVLVLKYRKK